MANKSKSLVNFIISIVVVLFITAIIWKNTQVDNSEIITKPKNIITKKTKLKSTIPETNQIVDNYQSENELPQTFSKQEKTRIIKSYNFQVKLSRLQSEEELFNAYKKYLNSGENAKAEKVLDKLLLIYPDFKIQ